MRVAYLSPASHHFDAVFDRNKLIRGGSLDDIKIYQRRGGSFFGIIGNVVKRALPFLRRIILPEVGNLINNVTQDISQNVPLRQSVRKNVVTSAKNVRNRLMRGGAKKRKSVKKNSLKTRKIKKQQKRKKKTGNTQCHSKKKSSDIFSGDIFSE